MGKGRVLVLDAANRVALATVRALGEAGWTVEVAEMASLCRRPPATFYCRHVRRVHQLPDWSQQDEFVRAVVRRASEMDVVLPVATNTILLLAAYREEIRAAFPFPPLELLRQANRKDRLLGIARACGVPVPETYRVGSQDELAALAASLRFPVVVKLRDDEGLFLPPRARYGIARGTQELVALYRQLEAYKSEPLVQEYADGHGYGVGAIAREGRLLRFLVHRRLRELPPSGGPSTACVSVVDDELRDAAERLLSALRWTGAAMVEFRRVRATGQHVLMELNPRFWGSLPLALHCGLNFPHDLCRMALGEDLGPPAPYPTGRRLRFVVHDAVAVAEAVLTGHRPGHYMSGFLADTLRGTADGVLEWSDPRASWRYLFRWP